MRIEIHLIDGTIVKTTVIEGSQEEDAKDTREDVEQTDPIFNRLRSLRNRAKRLGLWFSAVGDTERGLINASLLLRRLGRRIRIILEQLSNTLGEKLRAATLDRLRQVGLRAARSLVDFFYPRGVAVGLLNDPEYLLYLGVRETASAPLRAATANPQ
jgi:hypothetical protein